MNRESSRRRVALVIGSGGLKCAAALGVWQVLREAGIDVDLTVGCSGGSLYATALALGYGQEEASALTQQLWTADVARQRHLPSIRRALLPRLLGFDAAHFGLVDDRLIMARLHSVLGDATFAQTKLPLYMAATDLHSGEAVTISSGRLVDGIRASIAIPFIFAPWQVNGRALVDGAATNPIPVDVAIREGAQVIIAVGFANPFQTRIASVAQYAAQVTQLHMINLQKANFAFHQVAHHADVLPVMVTFDEDIGLTDTHKIPQIIAAGEKAAREQLPLATLDDLLAPRPATLPRQNGDKPMRTEIMRPENLPAQQEQEIKETAVSPAAANGLLLTVHHSGQPDQTVAIDRDDFIVGRSRDAHLALPNLAFVSARHFAIRRTEQGVVIVDLNSSNGTRLNNRGLSANVPAPLHDGDIIRIGEERFGVSVGFTFRDPTEPHAPLDGFGASLSTTQLLKVEQLSIGRAPDNDIVLDSPTVSRVHAYVEHFGEGEHLIRVAGDAAIWVNDAPTRQARLRAGDRVQIGPHLFTFDGNALTQFDSQGFRLDVVGVNKEVKTKNGPLRILDDVSMTVMPREFVALVGGSGAGKSTLLDALNGFRPAQGQVLVNGRDLYANYDSFRQQLGYVPQHDILPSTLKVEEALHFAARLRLPADVGAEERERRIADALETVDMNSQRIRQTRIDKLSGGQRKRVSIAAELIADPKLFFLDEPSSGLDPGLEKKLMYTLRKMADEGRTIILITHATANIVQVDHVGLLSQGRLVYFGPPRAAQEFFVVDDFADVYEKIEHNGVEWRQVFTQGKPAAYQKYVLNRQQKRSPALPEGQSTPQAGPAPTRALRQLLTLSQRMFRLTLSDPIAFFVALLVMPLVGVLQGAASETFEFTGDPAILQNAALAAEQLTSNYLPAISAQTFAFGMSILAFLVGAFGGSQELLKERSVYLRERMINLQLLPYLGSKFLVFGAFALVQVALYLLILSLQVELPSDGVLFKGFLELTITLWLTVMVGVATGLFISAVSASATMAVYLVLVVVFFQYIFGGAIHNLRDKPIEFQSYIASTRWATLAMGTTVGILEQAEATIVCGNELELNAANVVVDPATGAIDPASLSLRETDRPACSNRAVSAGELFLPYGNSTGDLLRFWGAQAMLGLVFALGALLVVKRLDRI